MVSALEVMFPCLPALKTFFVFVSSFKGQQVVLIRSDITLRQVTQITELRTLPSSFQSIRIYTCKNPIQF